MATAWQLRLHSQYVAVIQSLTRHATMARETGKKAASNASKTMRSKATGSKSKSAAGSALSQRKAPSKDTSAPAAKKASATLRDGRTNTPSKSAAGSALSQRRRSK